MRAVVAPLAGIAVATALAFLSRGLDDVAREGQLGPGFWPRLALVGFGVACLARVAGVWRAARRRAVASGTGPSATIADAAAPAPPVEGAKLTAAITLIVLYVLATPWLGFALTTAAFIVCFLVLAGMRSPAGIAANALVGTVGLLYVFVRLVYLPLPKGAGAVEDVTIALYRALGLF